MVFKNIFSLPFWFVTWFQLLKRRKPERYEVFLIKRVIEDIGEKD